LIWWLKDKTENPPVRINRKNQIARLAQLQKNQVETVANWQQNEKQRLVILGEAGSREEK
jgi:hypothetical protein